MQIEDARVQAERCFRLARAINDERTVAILEAMGRQLLAACDENKASPRRAHPAVPIWLKAVAEPQHAPEAAPRQ